MSVYIPCDRLKPFVRSLSIGESTEAGTYKVLPGTGVVIGFQYKGQLSYFRQESSVPLDRSGVTGLQAAFREFRNAAGTGTVLVSFVAGGAAAFFPGPVHELFGESLGLDHFVLRSRLAVLEEQLCEAPTNAEKVAVVERFLLAQLRERPPDTLVTGALALIHRSNGTIRMKDLAERLHTSASPLEKRFRSVVGASPKKFAAIVRMQRLTTAHGLCGSLTETGYAAGFYDQSHFIREFRSFTGETPRDFFAARKLHAGL